MNKLTMTICAGVIVLAAMSSCTNTTSNAAAINANSSQTAGPTSVNLISNEDSAKIISDNPMVGGAAMLKTKDIIDNAVNSKDHTTLVAAVKAAGLIETLKGAGPFTVFAPTNAAFEKLPKGTVEALLKPENKATLTKILTYHIVNGKQNAAAIAKAIQEGNGTATLKTISGGTLTVAMEGRDLILTDELGVKAKVTIADVIHSNGIIHVVDTVLMSK